MRKKISVIGDKGVEVGDELARRAEITDDLHGADVVVISGAADLDGVRRLAPAAVVLVAGDALERRCKEVYEATLFPRARIVGVTDAPAAAEAVAFDLRDDHEVVVMEDGQFAPRRARLGRGGIRELL